MLHPRQRGPHGDQSNALLRKMGSTCSRDPQASETAKTTLAYGYDNILYAKNMPVLHLYTIESKFRA